MKPRYYSLVLVGVCFAVFVLQLIFPVLNSLHLNSSEVLRQPWTIVTHMFLHGGVTHFLYNMFALALFGIILEKIIGTKRFLIIYFSAGLASALASIFFYDATLGASGAIFGILGCLAVLRPRMTVWVAYIPMPMAAAAVVWGLGDLLGMFAPGNVAHAAHIAGLVFGVAAGAYLWKQFGESLFKKKREQHVDEASASAWEKEWM